MAKLPTQRATRTEIDLFLSKGKAISAVRSSQPRLLFAMDATASRQPTWDKACHLQREMFLAANRSASLTVQLCYFRGFREFRAGPWTSDSQRLANAMARVYCEGGHTQIQRLLRHALAEHSKHPINAVVFVGDAMEESSDTLCELAGQCGIHRLPLFLFQEGRLPEAERCFSSMAKLSGGAWANFDQRSAETLAALLGAVASFASGGVAALDKLGTPGAKLLLEQLKQ